MSFVVSLLAAVFYSVSCALLSRSLGNAGASRATIGMLDSALPDADSAAQAKTTIDGASNRRRSTLTVASIALVLHGWVVIHQTGLPHDLSLPLITSVAATTLTIVLLHTILCFKQPADYLGLAVYPLAAASLLVSQSVDGGPRIAGDAVEIHVFLSLLAYAVLALAAAQAVLVATQRHYLSRHKPGGFIKALPPLDTTETLLFTLLGAGFGLLTLSLASGFFYLEDMFAQRVVHKTVLSCIGWGIFGVLLYGRWKFGWRGRKAVRWTLAGFGILILAYFGTKLVLEVLLQ